MPAPLTPEQKKAKIDAKNSQSTPTFKGVIRNASERTSRESRPVFNGTVGKLALSDEIIKAFDEAGWHLHIFNDTPGRIEEQLNRGYEFVTPEEIGRNVSTVVDRNKALDDKVKYLVGVSDSNDGLYAYLMKIPKEYFEANQADEQKRNDVVDRQIMSGKNTAVGGSSEGFYNAGTKFNNKG